MTRALKSLRIRLAVLGFAAIYLPVLILFGVTAITEDVYVDVGSGGVGVTVSNEDPFPWREWTLAALAPIAAGLAWWWSGRAVRPVGEAAETQLRLIEETSHELRTPLAVLRTNAEVTLAHPEPTIDLYREGLERSQATAVRLQRTIDELLVDARGRARAIDRRPADLAALAREVADEARPAAGLADVEIDVEAPETAVRPFDEPSLRRAIGNLVENAVRHSPAGARVEVAVEAGGDEAAVLVTDHGPGIPAEQRERVFERFWRGSEEGAGTGLGLPIARQVAIAHGGELSLRSPGPAGDGCEFRLRIASDRPTRTGCSAT